MRKNDLTIRLLKEKIQQVQICIQWIQERINCLHNQTIKYRQDMDSKNKHLEELHRVLEMLEKDPE